MALTPTELERLTIFTAAELARRHWQRGIRLSEPEAVALICDEILMAAREGRSVSELMGYACTILTTDDVLPGVVELVDKIQVEGMFADGAKMITAHQPIRPGRLPLTEDAVAGEILAAEGSVEINAGRVNCTVRVVNTADRPVQVGSHYHFFEANRALDFDRAAAFGMRLDIPAGTARRFEPGETHEVTLVQIGGTGEVSGFNGLVNGSIHDEAVKAASLVRARDAGFRGV